jgi:hypothetical protein
MEVRERLASTLQGEAKAYGYTLTIWSNGALLSHTFGTPKPAEVFGYLFGGLLGFALLVGYTARSPFTVGMEASDDSDLVAASTVHLLATPGNVILGYATMLLLAEPATPVWVVFLLVGLEATAVYNPLLVFEDFVGRRLPSATAEGDNG